MTISTDGSTPISEPANRVNDIEKPEPDIYDPFAPENLKLPPEFLDQTMATALLTTIPVEKPGDQEFIRVHPDVAYRHVAALSRTRMKEAPVTLFIQRLSSKSATLNFISNSSTFTQAKSLFGRSNCRKTIEKTRGWNLRWRRPRRP